MISYGKYSLHNSGLEIFEDNIDEVKKVLENCNADAVYFPIVEYPIDFDLINGLVSKEEFIREFKRPSNYIYVFVKNELFQDIESSKNITLDEIKTVYISDIFIGTVVNYDNIIDSIGNRKINSQIEDIIEVNNNVDMQFLIDNMESVFSSTTILFTNRYAIENKLFDELSRYKDLKFIYTIEEVNEIINSTKKEYISFVNAQNIPVFNVRTISKSKNIYLSDNQVNKLFMEHTKDYDIFEGKFYSASETAIYSVNFLKQNDIVYKNYYNNEHFSRLIILVEALLKCKKGIFTSKIGYFNLFTVNSNFNRGDYRYEKFPENQITDIIIYLTGVLEKFDNSNIQILFTKAISQNIIQINKYYDDIEMDRITQRNSELKKFFKHINIDNLKMAKVFYNENMMLVGKSFYSSQKGFSLNLATFYTFSPKGTCLVKLNDFVDKWDIELDNVKHKVEEFKTYSYEYSLDGVNKCNVKIISIDLYKNNFEQIDAYYNGKKVRIWGANTKNDVTSDSILSEEKCLLFFDRETKAGDNAEYMYRWFRDNKPEYKNIYFLISSESNDYIRLSNDGFNLIDSKKDTQFIGDVDFIFTSHIEPIVINHRRAKPNIQYVYLQHGITHHDLSYWFRANPLDYFCLSTREEQKIFENRLLLHDHNYMKTGFARHDVLYKTKEFENYISYFPTWRRQLIQLSDEAFLETEYYLKNKEFLSSDKLKEILIENNHKMRVILHPMLTPKLELFKKLETSEIQVLSAHDINYEDEFKKAHIGITDISSATYDVAIQGKHILFYVFDRDKLKYNHIYEPIVTEENDIGKYCYDAKQLIEAIDTSLNMNIDEKKFDEFFKFETGKACEGIFNHLVKMEATK